jgi:hypothetical protein
MGLLMLLAATISAAASSQADEMRIQGNSTNVKIEMDFEKPTKTQSLQAVISQLSSSVFQIVVADEHQACQLARIINSDLSPCFHEQRKENEPGATGAVVFHHNVTSKQRKTAQNALWLPKKHTRINALLPPHVLPQASQHSPDHPYMVSETRNNAPKDLSVTPVPPTKPPPGTHFRTTPNAAVSPPSADRPDVLLQDNRESEYAQTLNSSNTSNSTQNNLPTTAVFPTKLVPDSYFHTLATAPFIPAAHPDVLLQASQDFADHPQQQDLHGTPFPPPLLHPPLCIMPSVTSHHLCTVLTVYCTRNECTHYVLYSQCTH